MKKKNIYNNWRLYFNIICDSFNKNGTNNYRGRPNSSYNNGGNNGNGVGSNGRSNGNGNSSSYYRNNETFYQNGTRNTDKNDLKNNGSDMKAFSSKPVSNYRSRDIRDNNSYKQHNQPRNTANANSQSSNNNTTSITGASATRAAPANKKSFPFVR